jgi:ribosomal protein S18 acetylase RimI-like enzyme
MAITTSIADSQVKHPQLRSLNILRDLPAVADLIEKCFEDTMDAEGRRYIQDMRRAGGDGLFLRWATHALDSASLPLTGFVWEENGEIIGNVSIIPFHKRHTKIYLIANVAVRRESRRRGIGRALTISAMQYAWQRNAMEIWLHVRDDNPGAIKLYQDLGFYENARRTQWQAKPDRGISSELPGEYDLKQSRQDWSLHETWYKDIYPEMLTWYQPFPWKSLRPGIGPSLYRFFMEYEVRYWSLTTHGKPLGALTCESLKGEKARLWLAIPPDGGGKALTILLMNARNKLSWCQSLILDFPAMKYRSQIEEAGFIPYRTLLWMKLDPSKSVFDY